MGTLGQALNHIADALSLTMDGASWVYENSQCPAFSESEFSGYDFLADPTVSSIPAEFVA